jgi:hypothetical protein
MPAVRVKAYLLLAKHTSDHGQHKCVPNPLCVLPGQRRGLTHCFLFECDMSHLEFAAEGCACTAFSAAYTSGAGGCFMLCNWKKLAICLCIPVCCCMLHVLNHSKQEAQMLSRPAVTEGFARQHATAITKP